MSFSLNPRNLPRFRSFDDAHNFFNEARFAKKGYDNMVHLVRRGDDAKTLIRKTVGDGLAYAVNYHRTKMITYSRTGHGDFLHIDSGNESSSDRMILSAMTPFSFGTFRGRTTFDIDGQSFVCSSMDFRWSPETQQWSIDDIHGPSEYHQLTVTGRLSKRRRELLDHIDNYHVLSGKTKATYTHAELLSDSKMLAFAQVLCAAPEEWPAIAKAVHPSFMPRLKGLLLIAEGGVQKRLLPPGELPKKCAYDRFVDLVPLTA